MAVYLNNDDINTLDTVRMFGVHSNIIWTVGDAREESAQWKLFPQ